MGVLIRDISGNDNHTEWPSTLAVPPANPPAPGVGRSARSFNSFLTDAEEWFDGSVVVPTLAAASGCTIAAWCRPGSSACAGGGKVPFAFNSAAQLGVDRNRAMVRYDTCDFPDKYAIIDSEDPISAGGVADPTEYPVLTYQFVAMTITATELRLVVNGSETASKATTVAYPAASDSLTIGAELDLPADPSDFWEGRLDEILTFDRVVPDLDLAELTAIGLDAIDGDWRQTALDLAPVSYWPLDAQGWIVGGAAL